MMYRCATGVHLLIFVQTWTLHCQALSRLSCCLNDRLGSAQCFSWRLWDPYWHGEVAGCSCSATDMEVVTAANANQQTCSVDAFTSGTFVDKVKWNLVRWRRDLSFKGYRSQLSGSWIPSLVPWEKGESAKRLKSSTLFGFRSGKRDHWYPDPAGWLGGVDVGGPFFQVNYFYWRYIQK